MTEYLGRFAARICTASELEIRSDVTLGGDLVIDGANNITVSYAPFEHIQRSARVVIVGITPGAQQAANALCELRRHLLKEADAASALEAAKTHASFSGGMRSNLVEMLDHIGIARWLGVASTASLWTSRSELAHFTSALRYPVFFKGDNFNGQINMLRTAPLRKMLDTCLAAEATALPSAIWIPAGPKAEVALNYLVEKGLLRSESVLSGFLHPSTASNERVYYFLGRKPRDKLSNKTNPVSIDAAKQSIIAKVAALS